jgi:hypothetical protein
LTEAEPSSTTFRYIRGQRRWLHFRHLRCEPTANEA